MHCFRKACLAAAVVAGVGTNARAVLINEIDYDNPGTDTTEFVELVNETTLPVNLDGFSLVGFNGASPTDAAYRVIPLTGIIAPGGLFVIGNVPGANVDPTTNQDLFQNGEGDAIGLYSSGTFTVNTSTPTTAGLVDGVVYEGQDSFPTEFQLAAVSDDSSTNASLQRSPLTPGTGPFAFATPPTPGLVNSNVVVPEPASLGLVAVGGLLLLRRRTAAR